jgi:phosphoribosylamine-glycine ligase
MKVFIISTEGDSCIIARKLLQEGHEAVIYVRNRLFRKYLDPDIIQIKTPTVETVSSDLLLVEDNEAGRFADKARALHRLVICGGQAADKLTTDVEFNERSLNGCGISLAEANTQGTLVEIGGWFDGEKYLRPHLVAFKYYRLGTGDVGPLTSGTGIAAKYITRSRLYTDVLRKTETLMKSLKYVGYAGVEGFVNQSNFKAIKLHAKLQFPVVNAIGELHPTWGTFLLKLAKNQAEAVAVQPDKVVIGVSVLMQGYFSNGGQESRRIYCGTGQYKDEARAKVYKEIAKSNTQNGYYRIDIGDDFVEKLNRLKAGEWI